MLRFISFIILALSLSACSRPIPFSEYIAEQLLQENLASLTEPPLFELKKIQIHSIESNDSTGIAVADIVLTFPASLKDVAEAQHLHSDNMQYVQYKGSFGEFVAGEVQRHHARYHFQKRGKKWVIVGSEALSPPDITKP